MLDSEKKIYKLYRLEKGENGNPSVAKYKKDIYAVITMTSDRRDGDNTVGAMFLKKRYIGVANGNFVKDGDIIKDEINGYLRVISTEKKRNECYLHLESLSVYPGEAFDFEEGK